MIRAAIAAAVVALGSVLSAQEPRFEAGIAGVFDAELSFRPETADPADGRPEFFTAVEEQFGLKLTPQRRQVEVVVIDALSRPTPD